MDWIRANLALVAAICTTLALSASVIAQQVSDTKVRSHNLDESAHPKLYQMIQKTGSTVDTLSATMKITSQNQRDTLERLEKALDRLDAKLDGQ